MSLPWAFPHCEFFFLVAGYGSGKSFGAVLLILRLAALYEGKHVVIGVGGGTITLLRKTLLADLFRICAIHGQKIEYNKNEEIVTIGTVKFIIIATDVPSRVYAYNFSAFICDELDELPQVKSLEVFTAIQERVRIPFPDGRMPFSVFVTTAQGYRGTYQIVTDLKEKGIPYVLIRGQTKDNKMLPKSYVDRLYSIYNETERMVYLDGMFANLTTGRVYYEYNEDKHRAKHDPFKVDASDTIYVGQDLNAGYSRGVALVKRNKKLYVVKSWSFGEIGRAPATIRREFPQNRILWFPDASGNEVLTGYRSEIREHGIELRMGSVNPPIVDRCFFINKLFATDRCELFASCKDVSMALKVRQFNKLGDPEKGRGPAAPDHYCDGLEYAVWRLVRSEPDFFDIWQASRSGRQKGRIVAGWPIRRAA